MSEVKKLKVLVFGSINQNFKLFNTKLTELTSKTKFDLCLIAGNLTLEVKESEEEEKVIQGLKDMNLPIPVYFIGGSCKVTDKVQKLLESNSVNNLNYLGEHGIVLTVEGLKVGFLSGTYTSEPTNPTYCSYNLVEDIKANYVDVLLTYDVPTSITSHSQKPKPKQLQTKTSSSVVDSLINRWKPKYHFTSLTDTFYEREPFSHELGSQPGRFGITRFLGLADLPNPNKAKFVYGCSISLGDQKLVQPDLPKNCTSNPLLANATTDTVKRSLPQSNYFYEDSTKAVEPPQRKVRPNYLCNKCHIPGHHIRDCTHLVQKVVKWEECWFCLANPNASQHLVTAVGNFSYLALAKGPILNHRTLEKVDVPGGAHLILTPIHHTPNLPTSNSGPLGDEMTQFELAVERYFATKGCSKLTIQLTRSDLQEHLYQQIFPIPNHRLDQLHSCCSQLQSQYGLTPVEQMPSEGSFVQLNLSHHPTTYLTPSDPKSKFPTSFPREWICKTLNLPFYNNWNQNILPYHVEQELVQEFRQGFAKFDFTKTL